MQCHQDFEQGVGRYLAVSIDGPGELLHRVLDVAPQSFLYHVVHLLCVGLPMFLDLKHPKEIRKLLLLKRREEMKSERNGQHRPQVHR